MRSSARLPGRTEVLKDLNPPIVGVHDVNAIFLVNLQARRHLKLPLAGAVSEVVQELALAVKHLYDAPQPIDHVEMAFRIEADPLGRNIPPTESSICPMAYLNSPERLSTCTRKFIASTTTRSCPFRRNSVG